MRDQESSYGLRGELARMNTRDLARFAEAVGLRVRGTEDAKHLRGLLAAHLQDPAAVGPRIEELPRRLRRTLAAVCIAGSGRTGSFALRGDAKEQEIYADCQELARRGWLFPDRGYSFGRTPGFAVPSDVLGLYAQAAARAVPSADRPVFVKSDVQGESAGPELLAALVRVVGEVQRTPLKLTQQGTVYKRDIDRLRAVRGASRFAAASPAWAQIAQVLGPGAASLDGVPWSEVGPDVGMLIWTGLAVGLLDAEQGTVSAAPHGVFALAVGGRDDLWETAAISLMELLINIDTAALAIFRLLDKEIWLAPLEFLKTVFGVPLAVQTLEARKAAAASLLAAGEMGLVEAAMIGNAPMVRFSPVGYALVHQQSLPLLPLERTARILPSGDVLATDYLAPEIQAELERYARPAKVDVVTTYRIDQGLVALAASEGSEAAAVVDFFSDLAQDDLPQPVRFRLEEWLRDVGRVEFLEVALIACDSPEMRTRVAAIPAVRKEIVDLLGERWIIVPAAAEERLRTALQQQGIIPSVGVRRPSGLASERTLRQRARFPSFLGKLGWGVDAHAHPVGGEPPAKD